MPDSQDITNLNNAISTFVGDTDAQPVVEAADGDNVRLLEPDGEIIGELPLEDAKRLLRVPFGEIWDQGKLQHALNDPEDFDECIEYVVGQWHQAMQCVEYRDEMSPAT